MLLQQTTFQIPSALLLNPVTAHTDLATLFFAEKQTSEQTPFPLLLLLAGLPCHCCWHCQMTENNFYKYSVSISSHSLFPTYSLQASVPSIHSTSTAHAHVISDSHVAILRLSPARPCGAVILMDDTLSRGTLLLTFCSAKVIWFFCHFTGHPFSVFQVNASSSVPSKSWSRLFSPTTFSP